MSMKIVFKNAFGYVIYEFHMVPFKRLKLILYLKKIIIYELR